MGTARIGGAIVLTVLGLVLAFAVGDFISGVDTKMIGLILAGAGIVWLVLEIVLNGRRSAVTREVTNVAQPGVPGGTQQVEREVRHEA